MNGSVLPQIHGLTDREPQISRVGKPFHKARKYFFMLPSADASNIRSA